jgi:hypothetical protein
MVVSHPEIFKPFSVDEDKLLKLVETIFSLTTPCSNDDW